LKINVDFETEIFISDVIQILAGHQKKFLIENLYM